VVINRRLCRWSLISAIFPTWFIEFVRFDMNNAHAQYMAQKRFESLDGLRAISILAVIWHHTAPTWVGHTLSLIGAQGVSLFFAISGFLITTLLLREQSRNGRIDLKAFYMRRSLRIFPLYFGVLILYIAVVTLMERNTALGQAFYANLIYFATYTSNLFVQIDGRVIFYFAWSLAAEEQFYLLFPSLLLLAGTGKQTGIVLLVTFLMCVGGQLMGNKFLSAVPLAIVTGALLAITLNNAVGHEILRRILGQAWSAPVVGVALAVALLLPGVPGFVAALLFAAWVGACVIRTQHPLARLFSLKPVAYIGSISYGMYMLHMLCKNAVVKVLAAVGLNNDGLEVFALTFIVAVAAARLSFNYFENWFLGLKRQFER
jgi:peptidoglycan/LPS O-acetylase OafA/YrhL